MSHGILCITFIETHNTQKYMDFLDIDFLNVSKLLIDLHKKELLKILFF